MSEPSIDQGQLRLKTIGRWQGAKTTLPRLLTVGEAARRSGYTKDHLCCLIGWHRADYREGSALCASWVLAAAWD